MSKKIVRHPKAMKLAKFSKKITRVTVKTAARSGGEVLRVAAKTVIKEAQRSTSFDDSKYDASAKAVSDLTVGGKKAIVDFQKEYKKPVPPVRTRKKTEHLKKSSKQAVFRTLIFSTY